MFLVERVCTKWQKYTRKLLDGKEDLDFEWFKVTSIKSWVNYNLNKNLNDQILHFALDFRMPQS